MVRQVNIHEAKTHFSELIAAVERGEEIVIARRGKPVAKLKMAGSEDEAERPRGERVLGRWAGRIRVNPNAYEPLTDEELDELYPDLDALEDVARVQRQRRAG